MPDQFQSEVACSSNLTDADWAEIDKLKLAYEIDGQTGWSAAMNDLTERDPVRALIVIRALFPDLVRETIKEEMAELTVEDVRQLIRRLGSPGGLP